MRNSDQSCCECMTDRRKKIEMSSRNVLGVGEWGDLIDIMLENNIYYLNEFAVFHKHIIIKRD